MLKTVANSVKKERKLPTVALDLLRLALQEDKFPRFWKAFSGREKQRNGYRMG